MSFWQIQCSSWNTFFVKDNPNLRTWLPRPRQSGFQPRHLGLDRVDSSLEHQFNLDIMLTDRIYAIDTQAPRTLDYDGCTISDVSWAGKHERRKYLLDTFTYPPRIIPFLLCTFNLLSSSVDAFWYFGEGKSHELWNDRSWQTKYPLKTSTLPVSASLSETYVSRIGHRLACRVYGWRHGHFARLDRTHAVTRRCEW